MNQVRMMNKKTLLDELADRFRIKNGKRFRYSEKQAWYLTKNERIAARIIEKYVKPKKSITITDLYDLKELKVFWPEDHRRRYAVKYLVVFFKSMNFIKVKCNNGYKVIAWNQERERRIRRKRRAE